MQDLEQKIWEVETKVKSLEGNDLESLIADFNIRIDGITKTTINKLDSIKLDHTNACKAACAEDVRRQWISEEACRNRQAGADFYDQGLRQGSGQACGSFGYGLIGCGTSILCR